MMNIKQIKSVLIKIWAIVFLVLFSTWLIGGCIYNSIGKESIQEDIQQLKQELYSIKPIQNYFVKNVALANRRAIIAKSLRANILPITTEYTSELTLYEFERYFIRNGWDIVEYRKRPSLHIKASNEKYVVTLDLISSMNDEWRIQIGYNICIYAAETATAPVKRAGEVGDSWLKALYAVQAGMNAREIQKTGKQTKSLTRTTP